MAFAPFKRAGGPPRGREGRFSKGARKNSVRHPPARSCDLAPRRGAGFWRPVVKPAQAGLWSYEGSKEGAPGGRLEQFHLNAMAVAGRELRIPWFFQLMKSVFF